MKITIKKNQKKGMMGGVTFEIQALVSLTDEEKNLIKHYNLNSVILLKRRGKNIWGELNDTEISINVNSFTTGQTFSCKSLDEILSFKEAILSASENLKSYLQAARTFDGEESYEI